MQDMINSLLHRKNALHSENGEHRGYYSNGNVAVICNYDDDNINGEYRLFYESGKKWMHCFYLGGILSGEYRCYDNEGMIVSHCFFKDQKNIYTEIKNQVGDILNMTDEEKLFVRVRYGIDVIQRA